MKSLSLQLAMAGVLGFAYAAGRWSNSRWFSWIWRGFGLRQGEQEGAIQFLLRIAGASLSVGVVLLLLAAAAREDIARNHPSEPMLDLLLLLQTVSLVVGGLAIIAAFIAMYHSARGNLTGRVGSHPALPLEDDGSRFEGDQS
jgi:hypothetical protein